MTLTMRPQPISTLWPPNAILFGLLAAHPAATLVDRPAGRVPAHLLVELRSGIPLPMILCWFLSNSSEALIGASVVLVLGGGPARFDTFRGVGIFLLAALTSVFVSCFLDAGFVQLNGWGSSGYWENWSVRFLSNLLAQLTFVPVIVTWGEAGRRGFAGCARSRASRRRCWASCWRWCVCWCSPAPDPRPVPARRCSMRHCRSCSGRRSGSDPRPPAEACCWWRCSPSPARSPARAPSRATRRRPTWWRCSAS